METKQHYEKHLAEHYSWMFGDFDEKIKENEAFFISHSIKSVNKDTAFDLGAGSGFQSIPLSKLGFEVIAVDFSKTLLNELNERKGKLNIKTVESDIMDFEKYSNYKAKLIICMGDTLTHLTSHDDVHNMLENCYKLLTPPGKIIVSYRDLSAELKDENRFIPVKSTDNLIFTCFLEYEKEYVTVYDIINKKINGKWVQNISSYKKLKLSSENVMQYLKSIGFTLNFSETSKGFVNIIACK